VLFRSQIRQQTNHLMTFTEVRTDALTGIANRRGLDESLTGQLALMNRYGVAFSLAMFDIDHFKDVNDEQGHLRGDQTLQQVARLLNESAREPDVVARYGGEEFVVVMPQTDLEGACIFAERFRLRLQEDMHLTVSGGVTAALDGDTADSILSRADAALYQAKAAGRNRVFRHTGHEVEPIYEDAAGAVTG
jgi:diguanylate cyclase